MIYIYKMTEPSSFSTICTKNCKQELIGFLLSLSLHHPNANTYVICDTETKKYIDESTPYPLLNIKWKNSLDKYSKYDRNKMIQLGIWDEFQMAKTTVIEYALETEKDTLFLDSDIIVLDKLYIKDNTKLLGVSPQFIQQKNVDETGYYNSGMLWTNQKTLPNKWRKYTKTSRYHDQASIEDLVKEYDYFEFGENYNLQTWRFLLGLEPTQKIASYLNVKNNKVYYKDQPLKFIHTHFNSDRFKQINDFFIHKLTEAKCYRELAIIYRVINDKWVLQLPKQPMNGLFRHNNDSYRELAVLFKIKNKDVDIEYNSSSGHCWLKPNILTYDRPTLEWCNQEIGKSTILYLGNGSMEEEGRKLINAGLQVKPWIFWPRKPMVLEKILKNNTILEWKERTINSIFIGNFENSVQQKYRQTNHNWVDVLDEYHCTAGQKHKFTQEEYLNKLRHSKYGLCLRGYGSKCHREVELMAFGTIPIITNEVSISSYYDPPVEGTHYFKVSTPKELKQLVNTVPKKKWNNMSKSCYEWYQRNVHSDNGWNNMINNILYSSSTKIGCFGASLTQQPRGYVYYLKQELFNHSISSYPYGGMHLNDAGSFYIDTVVANNLDYLVIDWLSTGYTSCDKNHVELIENIILKCHKNKIIPIFIIPYRTDNDKRKDFYNYTTDILDKYNVTYLDLNNTVNEKHLNDIVHVNEDGGKIYASYISKCISNIDKTNYNFILPEKNKYYNIKSMKLDHKNIIVKDNTYNIDFHGNIIGILNKIGQYSPIVDIYDNDNFIREESIWDKHCAYERTHVNFKNIKINNNLKIIIKDIDPPYKECNNKNIDWSSYKKQLKLLEVFYI